MSFAKVIGAVALVSTLAFICFRNKQQSKEAAKQRVSSAYLEMKKSVAGLAQICAYNLAQSQLREWITNDLFRMLDLFYEIKMRDTEQTTSNWVQFLRRGKEVYVIVMYRVISDDGNEIGEAKVTDNHIQRIVFPPKKDCGLVEVWKTDDYEKRSWRLKVRTAAPEEPTVEFVFDKGCPELTLESCGKTIIQRGDKLFIDGQEVMDVKREDGGDTWSGRAERIEENWRFCPSAKTD